MERLAEFGSEAVARRVVELFPSEARKVALKQLIKDLTPLEKWSDWMKDEDNPCSVNNYRQKVAVVTGEIEALKAGELPAERVNVLAIGYLKELTPQAIQAEISQLRKKPVTLSLI